MALCQNLFKSDPIASLPDCKVEQIVSVPDLVPYDEIRRAVFIANGRSHRAGSMGKCRAGKIRDELPSVSVVRNEASGMVDDEMRRRIRTRRAARSACGPHPQGDRSQPGEAATFADILDGLAPRSISSTPTV